MKTNIKLARIDDRLLHATIALNWNRFVNANHVLIVNSQYKSDPFLEEIMQLSMPKSTIIKIVAPDHLQCFLENDISDTANIIILFKDLESLKAAVDHDFYFPEIQFPYRASRVLLKTLSDYFNEHDIKIIKYIQNKGIKFYFQTAPTDAKDYTFFLK